MKKHNARVKLGVRAETIKVLSSPELRGIGGQMGGATGLSCDGCSISAAVTDPDGLKRQTCSCQTCQEL
jgi:hypothetical protein